MNLRMRRRGCDGYNRWMRHRSITRLRNAKVSSYARGRLFDKTFTKRVFDGSASKYEEGPFVGLVSHMSEISKLGVSRFRYLQGLAQHHAVDLRRFPERLECPFPSLYDVNVKKSRKREYLKLPRTFHSPIRVA